MKKISIIFLLAGCMVILSGCAKTYTTEVTFDQFMFQVQTENAKLEEVTGEQKAIFENEENLYKTYTIMDKSGFSDSLLIHKEQLDTQIPLERLMQINTKTLKNRLQGFKANSSSQVDIKCEKEVITGYLQSFAFNSATPKKMVYMNQYFFENNGYLYILSSSTESSSNNKGYRNGFTNIQCKTP